MKAWVLHDIGKITLDEVSVPQPAAGEVLLKVHAAGICGSDIPRIYDTGAHSMPLIPGHEFAGEVVGVGAEVKDAWIGKRVGVFPLIPCRECRPCSERRYEMCRSYSYLGSRRDGGFAEYVVVPEWNLIELADNVAYEEAAMSEPMAVAVHAIRRVQPETSDTVVVCGLGTIGELIVMFLIDMGIKNILVVGNKDFQRQSVLKMGICADNFCEYRCQKVDYGAHGRLWRRCGVRVRGKQDYGGAGGRCCGTSRACVHGWKSTFGYGVCARYILEDIKASARCHGDVEFCLLWQ